MNPKIVYFGTEGKRSGHNAIGIDRNLSAQESAEWCKKVDTYYWLGLVTENPGLRLVQVNGIIYTAYSVPYSVDDERPGSHTNVFYEGEHTESEMLELIKSNAFLKRQFDK